MQMVEPGLVIDVMRVPADRGNAAIEGLPALPHHDEIVDGAGAERSEDGLPWRRQKPLAAAKRFRYGAPGAADIEVTGLVRLVLQPRAGAVNHGRLPAYRSALPRGMVAKGGWKCA